MKLLREILVCLLLIAGIALLVRGVLFVQHADETLQTSANQVSKSAAEIQKRIDGTFQNVNALLIQAGLTADEARRTSMEERVKLAAFSDASIQAVNDLDQVAKDGAGAVRSLQAASDGLSDGIAAVKDDSRSLGRTIDAATALLGTLDKGSGQALRSLDDAVKDAGSLVADARPSVEHANSMSGHLDDGSNSLAQTLGFIRDDFSPKKKSFWVRLADSVTAGMFSIALHWLPQRVEEIHR